MGYKRSKYSPAFTIVELLVVIVVIGILATITIVAYTGIQRSATVALIQSDLASASNKIKMYQAENGIYPTAIDCSASPATNSVCIKPSSGSVYSILDTNNAAGGQAFCLAVKNNNIRYYIENNSSPATGTCVGVSDGLVAYYPFENNANDYSGNGNNGFILGGTTLNDGIIGRSYLFNGVNGSIYVPDNNNLDFGTGSFSISYWGYYKNYTYPKTFGSIKKSNPSAFTAGGIGWDFGHGYNASGIDACLNDGVNIVRSPIIFNVGSRPPDLMNKWTHFVFVVDRNLDKVSAYVNGVKQTSEVNISTITGSLDNTDTLSVAMMYGWYVDGSIDDLRIYNKSLSSGEVDTLYNL